MGAGSYDSGAYRSYAQSTQGKSTSQIYRSRTLDPYLDPLKIKFRESRDSTDNPLSTPIIVAVDVTGSMGMLADAIARHGLGVLFEGILTRRPVTNPHLMFMGIGDVRCDVAPLQVSQFEADNRIVEQLTKIWIEHGGGGNFGESYDLAWYFAAYKTVHDSIEKRGKRGYLFTVGDEPPPPGLTVDTVKQFIGDDVESDAILSPAETLAAARRKYDCYHLIVEEGQAGSHPQEYRDLWTNLMGESVILLPDHKKLAEVIVSAIEVAEGRDATASAQNWADDQTRKIVHAAIKALPRGRNNPQLSAP